MSQQRISHGAMLDIPTLEEIAEVVSRVTDTQKDAGYHREPGTINLDGTGAGTGILKTTREFGWLCERVALATAAGAIVDFFHNQQQFSDLAESVAIPASGRYTDAFSNNLYVPAGSQLLIVCSGGSANGQLSYGLQIRLIRAVE